MSLSDSGTDVLFCWNDSSLRERLDFLIFVDSKEEPELGLAVGFIWTSVSTSIFSCLSFKGTVNSVCASTFTPSVGIVEAQTEFTVPLKDKQENIEVETDVQINPTASPSSSSSYESTNIKKPNFSLNDKSFQQKSTSVPESDKDTINPKILLEKEDLTLQQQQQQQQQTRKDFSSNPFITYSLFWQHIVSDWVSFYDEYLKNLIKFNGFWFEKSGNSSSSSQQ